MATNTRKRAAEEEPESNVVAVGVQKSPEEAQEKLEQLRDKVAASSRLQQLAHSSSQLGVAKERRSILQADDLKPNLSKLNDKQKRALERRKGRRSKVLKARLEKHETRRLEAAVAAEEAQEILETTKPGMLEPENDMEHTNRLSQVVLKRDHLDPETAKNIFDLTLTESAPYGMKYDRSGRYSLLHGEKGHLALMDNHQRSLMTEFNVRERVRDACFLHNFTLMAVAQKNHAYIYDQNGAEIHQLTESRAPVALDFLPYHWLLVSLGRIGHLKYQDTSTGQLVSTHHTVNPCSQLRQNPTNAVMHVGHCNGTVSLWCPSTPSFLVKVLCHKGGSITSLAIDQAGHTMVTGGTDQQVKIWDLRTYQERHSFRCRGGVPTSLDISQRGLLAVGHSAHVTVWPAENLNNHVAEPYMHQLFPRCGPIETVRFRPFEDVLGVGHARGVSSMVIPGSGEPQIDTAEYNLNPMADATQRREAEVRALLDKLQPDMIALDPDQVAGIEASDPQTAVERLQDLEEEANQRALPAKKAKTTRRGQSKIQVKMRFKQRNVDEDNRKKLRESKEMASAEEQGEKQGDDDRKESEADAEDEDTPAALKRFF